MFKRPVYSALTGAIMVSAIAAAPTLRPAQAQPPQPAIAAHAQAQARVTQNGGAIAIQFGSTSDSAARAINAEQAEAQWPRIRYGDLMLPGQLALVQLSDSQDAVALASLARALAGSTVSVAFDGSMEQVVVPIPQTPDGEQWPDLQRAPLTQLPASPVSILSQGVLRGTRLAVLAITPIYAQDGQTRFAAQFPDPAK